MRVELACCESVLLNEIADPAMKRADVALTYAMALRSSEAGIVDWAQVNKAIMERWSKSSLTWIKERAWKILEGKPKETSDA